MALFRRLKRRLHEDNRYAGSQQEQDDMAMNERPRQRRYECWWSLGELNAYVDLYRPNVIDQGDDTYWLIPTVTPHDQPDLGAFWHDDESPPAPGEYDVALARVVNHQGRIELFVLATSSDTDLVWNGARFVRRDDVDAVAGPPFPEPAEIHYDPATNEATAIGRVTQDGYVEVEFRNERLPDPITFSPTAETSVTLAGDVVLQLRYNYANGIDVETYLGNDEVAARFWTRLANRLHVPTSRLYSMATTVALARGDTLTPNRGPSRLGPPSGSEGHYLGGQGGGSSSGSITAQSLIDIHRDLEDRFVARPLQLSREMPSISEATRQRLGRLTNEVFQSLYYGLWLGSDDHDDTTPPVP